jgi:hypothetical protein
MRPHKPLATARRTVETAAYPGKCPSTVAASFVLEANMMKIRNLVLVLGMMVSPLAAADTQVNIGIGFPHVSLGIHLPAYPRLVRVPNYPVYYAPHLDVNYFFYDGLYWVFYNDNWYASSWYNGPWAFVSPFDMPVFILRVPVRYYRHPPTYFRHWHQDEPPRWKENWGRDWEQRRGDWNERDRRFAPAAPRPAPLPYYQREYSRDRYPREVQQQRQLIEQKYHYQPREPAVRQHYQEMGRGPGDRDRGRGN